MQAQPPQQKLSRYRTVRGRNAPQPQRSDELLPSSSSGTAGNGAEPPARHAGSGAGLAVPVSVPVSVPGLPGLPGSTLTSQSALSGLPDGLCSLRLRDAAQTRRNAALGPPAADVADVADVDVAESERLLEEQKRQDLERLRRQLASHEAKAPPPKSPVRDRFAFLTRRRGRSSAESAAAPPPSSQARPHTSATSQTTTAPVALHFRSAEASSQPRDPPPPSPSFVPGKESSRQILMRYRQFSAKISVDADTTVSDALRACSELFPGPPIDAASSVLTEVYSRLGLERRLRRYERVRDVVNSWDTGDDNSLVISSRQDIYSATEPVEDGPASSSHLELSAVPRQRAAPALGFSGLPVYHSQRPGRWTKRLVSFAADNGQLVVLKKAGSSGDDVHSLCHLSDYDIYTPTTTQMRRHLKPPKRFCFAVKSLQRTAVFVDTLNYVHFFCTETADDAQTLHHSLFAWRSWYLVNRQLSLASSPGKQQQQQQHQRLPDQPQQQPEQRRHHLVQAPPSSSLNTAAQALQRRPSRRSADVPRHHAVDGIADSSLAGNPSSSSSSNPGGAFAAGGLLGNAYDERKRSELGRQRSTASQVSAAAPLPHDGSHGHRTASGSSKSVSHHPTAAAAAAAAAAATAASLPDHHRQQPTAHHNQQQHHNPFPTPLIDLTPKFQEAPQWSTEKRGHGVRAPPGTAHLVDLATGWQGPSASGTRDVFLPRNDIFRRGDAPAAPPASAAAAAVLPSDNKALRSKTMTAASAATAAHFSRGHHSLHRSNRINTADQPPPSLAQLPPQPALSSSGANGIARGRRMT